MGLAFPLLLAFVGGVKIGDNPRDGGYPWRRGVLITILALKGAIDFLGSIMDSLFPPRKRHVSFRTRMGGTSLLPRGG